MSHLTKSQIAQRKIEEYGMNAVIASYGTDVSSILYMPADGKSVDTVAPISLLAISGSIIKPSYDFIKKNNGGLLAVVPPEAMLVDDVGNWEHVFAPATNSFIVMHTALYNAQAAWTNVQLGVKTVGKGEIIVAPGACEIASSTADSDVSTYTTEFGTGDICSVAMFVDRTADELRVYEGLPSAALTLKDTVSTLSSGAIVTPPLSEVKIGQFTSLTVYGTIVVVFGSGVPIPATMLTSLAAMRDSWVAGTPLVDF